MKRILSFILTLAICLSMVACGGAESGTTDSQPDNQDVAVNENIQGNFLPLDMDSNPMGVDMTYEYVTTAVDGTPVTGYVRVKDYMIEPVEDTYEIRSATIYIGFEETDKEVICGITPFLAAEAKNTRTGNEYILEFSNYQDSIQIFTEKIESFSYGQQMNVTTYYLQALVPVGYDEFGVLLYNAKNGENLTDADGKVVNGADMTKLTDENSLWFGFGSNYGNGINYKGSPLPVMETSTYNEVFNSIAGVGYSDVQTDVPEYIPEDNNPTTAMGGRVEILSGTSTLFNTYSGATMEIEEINLIDGSDPYNYVFEVCFDFQGIPADAILGINIYNSYEELPIMGKEFSVTARDMDMQFSVDMTSNPQPLCIVCGSSDGSLPGNFNVWAEFNVVE